MKRIFDFILAIATLTILAIPMLILAFEIRRRIGKPVIFVQERPGLGGQPFKMYKFRTMTNERDASGLLKPDSYRLTSFGKKIRALSLDELPELWNVIKGDMSLVGPRPLLMQYLPLYSQEQARRHDVLPGITGWAQVNGRNAISWDEKFMLDIWYVDNKNFWLDLKIIIKTIKIVLNRRGINARGSTTMPAFEGRAQKNVPSE